MHEPDAFGLAPERLFEVVAAADLLLRVPEQAVVLDGEAARGDVKIDLLRRHQGPLAHHQFGKAERFAEEVAQFALAARAGHLEASRAAGQGAIVHVRRELVRARLATPRVGQRHRTRSSEKRLQPGALGAFGQPLAERAALDHLCVLDHPPESERRVYAESPQVCFAPPRLDVGVPHGVRRSVAGEAGGFALFARGGLGFGGVNLGEGALAKLGDQQGVLRPVAREHRRLALGHHRARRQLCLPLHLGLLDAVVARRATQRAEAPVTFAHADEPHRSPAARAAGRLGRVAQP